MQEEVDHFAWTRSAGTRVSAIPDQKRYRRQLRWTLRDTRCWSTIMRRVLTGKLPGIEVSHLGNVYCRHKNTDCGKYRLAASKITRKRGGVLTCSVFASPSTTFAVQPKPRNTDSAILSDEVLGSSLQEILSLCSKSRMVLEAILNNTYTDTRKYLYQYPRSDVAVV
jgi:hypothetical protein